jgi:hypothetical protein
MADLAASGCRCMGDRHGRSQPGLTSIMSP